MNIIDKIQLKFTSGNSIPVQRAQITVEEWVEVIKLIERLETRGNEHDK